MSDTASQPTSPSSAPIVVTGRTPYDTLSELFALLGRALPWVTVLALFLYTLIETNRSYQAAQAAVSEKYTAELTKANDMLKSTFAALDTLRNSQVDSLGNFSKVNQAVVDSIAKNQAVLLAARDEIAKERENQEAAGVKLREALRDLQDAKLQQSSLERQRIELERKVWAAESTIDAADRLATFVAERQLGQAVSLNRRTLSLRFENARPDAISRDAAGELYYGRYRIVGSQMGEFLTFLRSPYPALADRLEDVGGAKAAKQGAPGFRAEWESLSRNVSFNAAQDTFIEKTKFDPFLARTQKRLADAGVTFEPTARSEALLAVLWSVAVQYGPDNPVVIRAFDGLDLTKAIDEKLIQAIYAERRQIQRYFPDLNATYKTLLSARYVFEEEMALKMLQQSQESKR